MAKFKVVTDPVTGLMRSVPVGEIVTPEALEALRQEVRARISGNEQFHVDEFATPRAPTIYDHEDWCA